MTPYDQRIARVVISLSRGVDDPTLDRIEALMGIVHAYPPPRRYDVEVRHG
jgi:hypothetical protein